MLSFFKPEVVTVISRSYEKDDLGEVVSTKEEKVEVECLVAPSTTTDLDAERTDGTEVVYSLSFPKTFTGSLRGSLVEVRGERFQVTGDPQRYTAENCPTPYNLTVEVVRVNG